VRPADKLIVRVYHEERDRLDGDGLTAALTTAQRLDLTGPAVFHCLYRTKNA
jgi:hypothetical protein